MSSSTVGYKYVTSSPLLRSTDTMQNWTTTPDCTTFNTSAANITNCSLHTTPTIPLESDYPIWAAVIIGILFSIILLGTMFGNMLVCLAVSLVNKLRTPPNLLIVSLAVSDLLVSLLVMPFAVIYELMGYWPLGQGICDMFTSLDVTLCTASILNLCMISVDRYFAITKPFQYAPKRTYRLMAIMIVIVWLGSALVSIPPLFVFEKEVIENTCTISQAIGYQIYATVGAFYLPMGIMIAVYWKIYRAASRISKAEARSQGAVVQRRNLLTTNNNNSTSEPAPNGNLHRASHDSTASNTTHSSQARPQHRSTHRSSRSTTHKEGKAIKTLGVIMGAFTLCWLPFFILALIAPFVCDEKKNNCPKNVFTLFQWLGYFNCFLNPIIYARYNREFRRPFRDIICCHCRGINRRIRNDYYADQFGAVGASAARGSVPSKSSSRDTQLQRFSYLTSDSSTRQPLSSIANGLPSTSDNT